MSALRTAQVAPGQSDHRLVAAVRAGDDQAFAELYSRYDRRIVSYVYGMLGDHARAEDVAQEVFISALRRMRATERPIAFKPWVYEIARNACIDEFRRTRRAQEVPLDSGDESEGPEHRLESRTGSPHAALERRQKLDDLRGAFRGLSTSHHKIIVLRELEGLSYTEIGRRMGMSRAVVESTLFRARRRLGAEYEEIASGRRCEQVHAVIDAGGEKAVRALGIRERRRVARHVAHCQPCRRHAHLAGVDDSVLKGLGLVEKIAALLPIPAFLRWRHGASQEKSSNTSASHSAGVLQSMPTVARFVDPAAPVFDLGRTTAALVAAAVLAGGGVAGTLISVGGGGSSATHPVAAHVRSIRGASSSGTSAPPTLAAPSATPRTATEAAPTTSGGGGGTGNSQPGSTQSTSSSSPSNTAPATESHTGLATGSSEQTTSTSQTSATQPSSAQSPSSSSSSSSSLLPQLPSGQSGSALPQSPQISTPQLPQAPQTSTPQLPNLNAPTPPSAGSVVGTAHKLLP